MTDISDATFNEIRTILQTVEYQLPKPTKLKDNNVSNAIGAPLAELIGKHDAKHINRLYLAAHSLKIQNLKKCLAAVMACRVFVQPTLESYNAKKTELGIEKDLTPELSKEYKERFPFMN